MEINMKKFMLLIAVVAVFFGAFTLTGCDGKKDTKNYREAYLVSAIAGANYLETTQNFASRACEREAESAFFASAKNEKGALSFALEDSLAVEDAGRPEEISGDIEALNGYVNMFDGLLSGNSLNAELDKPSESTDGEYASYAKKMVAFVAGEKYVMYFNEVDSKTEIEIDDGEEEVEISSRLVGVLVNGQSVFDVSGKYETEREGTETETVMEFTTRSVNNPDNYVKVEQSVENDEIEYEYSIYENGRLVSKTKVEWEDPEFEDDDDDGGLSIQFGTTVGNEYSKTKYHIVKDKNNLLKVIYKTEQTKGSFAIRQTESENIYTYLNGFEEALPR